MLEYSRTYLILLAKSVSGSDLSESIEVDDVERRDVVRSSVQVLFPISDVQKRLADDLVLVTRLVTHPESQKR